MDTVKYHVNIAWSYFEAPAIDFINFSQSVNYQDLKAAVKPYTHFESFQIEPGHALASLGGPR